LAELACRRLSERHTAVAAQVARWRRRDLLVEIAGDDPLDGTHRSPSCKRRGFKSFQVDLLGVIHTRRPCIDPRLEPLILNGEIKRFLVSQLGSGS
jgi:hypothetical protein